jgi:hypothetical protein
MIVDFVYVLFHFARQRWSDFAATGFALYVDSCAINQNMPARQTAVIKN